MNLLPAPEVLALAGARRAIDQVDDVLLLLVAARRRIVRMLAPMKRRSGEDTRDRARETQVHARAQRLARRLDVPQATARQLIEILIRDACRQQGLAPDLDQGARAADTGMIASAMTAPLEIEPTPTHGVAASLPLPPPRRCGLLLRAIPPRWRARAALALLGRAVAPLGEGDTLEFLRGRRFGIEVSDLDLRWTLAWRDGRLRACVDPAEATVRGSLTDLLLLASRLEDADTLFFQRRLVLTGDTELGLTLRNVLDRLPWEQVPLGLRIALNRLARFAARARGISRSGIGAAALRGRLRCRMPESIGRGHLCDNLRPFPLHSP